MTQAKTLAAALVLSRPGGEPVEYPMFEVRELDGEGASLAGPLVLEVGERLALRIDAAEPVRVAAVVEAASPERGMQVRFVDLGEGEAARLAALGG